MAQRLQHIFIKTLSIILMTIYSSVIFQPIVKYVAFKFNQEYIVTNVCNQTDKTENLCLGNCYLKKEIADALDKSQESTTQVKLSISEVQFEFFVQSNYSQTTFQNRLHSYCSLATSPIFKNYEPIVPPPKYS